MAKTTDFVEPNIFVDTWLKEYIDSHEEKLAEAIDHDLFKRVYATRVSEDFIDVINAFIQHTRMLGNTKTKVWYAENLVLRYAADRINEMMRLDCENDINNYKNIIESTRKIRKKISRVAKEKADLISVVGESRKTFHVEDVTYGMYLDIAEILGVSVVGVVKFALHVIFNESTWINKEFDFMKPTYLTDWDNRSYKIIEDRMETRAREIKRGIEQIYDRYLSLKDRYVNGETIGIEYMKSDIKWLNAIKKEGMLDNDIDDFESITRKRKLIESGHDETEAHRIALDEKCNSDMKSFMDMVTQLHKLIKSQDDKIKSQDDKIKSQDIKIKELRESQNSKIEESCESQNSKIEEWYESQKQTVKAICNSYDVKLTEQHEVAKHENIILKTGISKINEKLELLSESRFNKIKKLVFK